MPVVIPEGFGQFVLRWSSPNFDSGGAATVLGFGRPGPGIMPLEEFAYVIGAAHATYLRPLMDSQTSLASIYYADATTSGEIQVGEAGGRSGEAAAPNVALLTTYVTSAKGRRGRGRSYWPSMIGATDAAETGLLGTGRLQTLTDAFEGFWEDIIEEDVADQVVLQRDEPGQVTPPLSPPPVVTGRIVQRRVATQRRRLRR